MFGDPQIQAPISGDYFLYLKLQAFRFSWLVYVDDESRVHVTFIHSGSPWLSSLCHCVRGIVGEERLAGRERAHALISMAGSSISESQSRKWNLFLIPIEIEACASPFQHRIRTGLQAEHQQLNHERNKIIEGSTHSRSNLIWYINWRIIPFYFLFSIRTYLDSDLFIIIKYFLIVFYI